MSSVVPTSQGSMPVLSRNGANGHGSKMSDVIMHLVAFRLNNEEFAVPILDVREIIRTEQVTPVPHAPSFVEGVINLRGQIIPVIDLRKRFNLAAKTADEDTRVMVIELGTQVVGLIVDSVSEVTRIPSDTVAPPPPLVAGGIGAEYIKGISHHDKRMTILVDMHKVFKNGEVDSLARV